MTQRDYRIDNLRALAILSVVLGHSIILYSPEWQIYQTTQSSVLFSQIKHIINLYQMPLFFSLSGYLFAGQKNQPFIEFFSKKTKRLLIPFLSVGLCYMLPIKLILGYPPFHGKSQLTVIKMFLLGNDTGHLWFLPTLFLVFLTAFFVKRILKKNLVFWVAFLVASFLLWKLQTMIPIRHPLLNYLKWTLEYEWSFAFGAVVFHLTKWTCSMNTKKRLLLGCLPISFIALVVLLDLHVPTVVFSALICSACFFLVPNRRVCLFTKISQQSFGVYLFHSPLIYITFSLIPNASPLIVASVNLFLFGSIAFFLANIISKSRFKLLIGM